MLQSNRFYSSHYFRISLTNVCNLNCYFCHNEGQSKIFNKLKQLTPDDIVWITKIALNHGYTKIKLSGGEPTLRKDIFEIIKGISSLNVKDLSMITNGIKLYELAQDLKYAGLTRLNLSLFTLNAEQFKLYNGGNKEKLEKIIRGIDKAIEVGFRDIKLNYVWHNKDSIIDFLEISKFALERNLTVVLLPLIETNLIETDEVISLDRIYPSLKELGIKDEEEIIDNEGLRKKLITMNSGVKVLLRKDELKDLMPFSACQFCSNRQKCREGIFPIRLSNDGILRTCLFEGIKGTDLFQDIKERNEENVSSAFNDILIYVNKTVSNLITENSYAEKIQ